ncbi:MAG: hypothetical protein AB7S77_22305 [Desulfatirhabdiaceae bacterium]
MTESKNAKKMKKLPSTYQPWVDARKRFHLSHAHIQMTRELGMNPKKFGKLANHKQDPWKLPLPEFIAECYRKHFGKNRPDDIRPLEQIVAEKNRKKAERKTLNRKERNRPEMVHCGSEDIRQKPSGSEI